MKDLLSSPLLVLSPHADDAVLSCGGLLSQHEDAVVVTAFSGDAPESRVGALAGLASPELRRAEDAAAMARLGCSHHLLGIPDAIDRRGPEGELINRSMASLFGPVSPLDSPRCAEIQEAVDSLLGDRILLAPMAVGAHVDHQLCAHAARRLQAESRSVWFYEDAPYVFPDAGSQVLSDSVMRAARRLRATVRGTWDLPIESSAKEEVLACYSSQIEALFGDMESYRLLAQAHYLSLSENPALNLERFYLLRWQ
jgi:LmbE family N-acetylglucosaminyl deacetylase